MTLKQVFENEEHRWNAWYSLGFVVLIFVMAGFVWLVDERFPESIDLFDFLLLSLATFRLVRLVVYDRVALFVREYFGHAESGPKKVASDLLNCPWCFGMWAGAFVVFFYYVMPMAWFVILILAVSGVASFIQLITNKIGWKAELLKMEAQEKE